MIKPPPFKALQLGGVVLLTAAIAFPAGLWVAGALSPDTPDPPPPTIAVPAALPSRQPLARNPYSTSIRRDPYVLDRQRVVVEAMETACRRLNERCAEARAARRYLARQAADDR